MVPSVIRSAPEGALLIGDAQGDTFIWNATTQLWETGPGSGVGSVSNVFGRVGAIVAVAGDYNSDQINNISNVSGASVSDALDYLLANLGGGDVSSVFGRVGAVTAANGDYNSTNITNSSAVSGADVTAALNSLLASTTGSLQTGANLTGAAQTLATAQRYLMLPGVTVAACVIKLTPPATFGKGFALEIGTQAHDVTIQNDGPLGTGIGLQYTVLAGSKEAVWFTSDGANCNVGSAMPLAAEPV